MPITIDIHENEFLEGIYQDGKKEGLEQGIEQGLSQGLEQGLEQGRLRAAREVLLDLLAEKFGSLPAAVGQRVGDAGLSDIRRWSRRVLQAPSLDGVFQ